MTSTVELGTAVLGLLNAVPNLIVFDSDVPALTVAQRDSKGRAKPYAVLYVAPGRAVSDRLNHAPINLYGSFQVTAAAGTPDGARWAVDRIRGALTGVELLGPDSGRIRERADPGPVQKDKDVESDIRWFSPLLFGIATAASL